MEPKIDAEMKGEHSGEEGIQSKTTDSILSNISPELLGSLETNARNCAKNVTTLMHSLQNSLQVITELSVQHMNVYRKSLNNLNEAVGTSIIDLNELITKAQELNEDLRSVDELAVQIRDIKRTLETFENGINRIK